MCELVYSDVLSYNSSETMFQGSQFLAPLTPQLCEWFQSPPWNSLWAALPQIPQTYLKKSGELRKKIAGRFQVQ